MPVILGQIFLIGLLVFFNSHPAFRPSFGLILFAVAVVLVLDVYVFFLYRDTIRSQISEVYIQELRDSFSRLLKPYQTLSLRQKTIRDEVHEILNAQFSYHSLITEGDTAKAEEFRLTMQSQWKREEQA